MDELKNLQAELDAELKLALNRSQRSISAGGLRELLRPFLARRLAINEDSVPMLPDAWRPLCWKILLGAHTKDEAVFEAWDQKTDLPEQAIIHSDSLRTRPTNPALGEQGRRDLEKLISLYCKSRG